MKRLKLSQVFCRLGHMRIGLDMTSERLDSRLKNLRDNVFADQRALDRLERRLAAGEITDTEALNELRRIEPGRATGPSLLLMEQVEDEWEALAEAISEAENRAKQQASSQFFLGLTALPLCVLLIIVSLLFGWQTIDGSSTVAIVFTACLGAIAAHSFFVLRIQQQASLAAERLAEKRVGILFLRIATSRENSEDSLRLLDAGTKMFLGHQAPATIPLQAEDYSAIKK